MSRPLQPVSHSDPGRLANSQTQEACEAKPPEARHQSPLSTLENVRVVSWTLGFCPHFHKHDIVCVSSRANLRKGKSTLDCLFAGVLSTSLLEDDKKDKFRGLLTELSR